MTLEAKVNTAMCIHLVSNIILVGLLPDFLEGGDEVDEMFMLEDPLIFSTVTSSDGSVMGSFTEVGPYSLAGGHDCVQIYRQQMLGDPYEANQELSSMYFSAIGNKVTGEAISATASGVEALSDGGAWAKR